MARSGWDGTGASEGRVDMRKWLLLLILMVSLVGCFAPPTKTIRDPDDEYLRKQVADEEIYKPTSSTYIRTYIDNFFEWLKYCNPGHGW